MFLKLAVCLVAAFLILPFGFSYPTTSETRNQDVTKLRPIGIHDYEAAMGLHRRDSGDFSDLDLRTQSQLIYGSPGSR